MMASSSKTWHRPHGMPLASCLLPLASFLPWSLRLSSPQSYKRPALSRPRHAVSFAFATRSTISGTQVGVASAAPQLAQVFASGEISYGEAPSKLVHSPAPQKWVLAGSITPPRPRLRVGEESSTLLPVGMSTLVKIERKTAPLISTTDNRKGLTRQLIMTNDCKQAKIRRATQA